MKELQVRLYDVTTDAEKDIHIGNVYVFVPDNDADRILDAHDSNAEIFMDPVYAEFIDQVERLATEIHGKYFDEHTCDVRLEIAKRI